MPYPSDAELLRVDEIYKKAFHAYHFDIDNRYITSSSRHKIREDYHAAKMLRQAQAIAIMHSDGISIDQAYKVLGKRLSQLRVNKIIERVDFNQLPLAEAAQVVCITADSMPTITKIFPLFDSSPEKLQPLNPIRRFGSECVYFKNYTTRDAMWQSSWFDKKSGYGEGTNFESWTSYERDHTDPRIDGSTAYLSRLRIENELGISYQEDLKKRDEWNSIKDSIQTLNVAIISDLLEKRICLKRTILHMMQVFNRLHRAHSEELEYIFQKGPSGRARVEAAFTYLTPAQKVQRTRYTPHLKMVDCVITDLLFSLDACNDILRQPHMERETLQQYLKKLNELSGSLRSTVGHWEEEYPEVTKWMFATGFPKDPVDIPDFDRIWTLD